MIYGEPFIVTIILSVIACIGTIWYYHSLYGNFMVWHIFPVIIATVIYPVGMGCFFIVAMFWLIDSNILPKFKKFLNKKLF